MSAQIIHHGKIINKDNVIYIRDFHTLDEEKDLIATAVDLDKKTLLHCKLKNSIICILKLVNMDYDINQKYIIEFCVIE